MPSNNCISSTKHFSNLLSDVITISYLVNKVGRLSEFAEQKLPAVIVN